MKPGDLVRINLPAATIGRMPVHGKIGIVIKSGVRATSRVQSNLFVWWVLLADGKVVSFEPSSLLLLRCQDETR